MPGKMLAISVKGMRYQVNSVFQVVPHRVLTKIVRIETFAGKGLHNDLTRMVFKIYDQDDCLVLTVNDCDGMVVEYQKQS